jgi:glycosyltransferase involved in cell wall biosynthesis
LSLSFLKSKPDTRNPLAFAGNLRVVAGRSDCIFAPLPTALIAVAERLRLLRNRLVQLFWSTPNPGVVRRALFRDLVRAARVAIVNDRATGRELCTEWGLNPAGLKFLRHPIDTEFFTPAVVKQEPYLLVPGNQDRNEQWVSDIADAVNVPVIRATSSQRSIQFHRRPNSRVRVSANVSYLELRELYRSAMAVVIPVINHRHPAGLTTLLEAMACGKTAFVNRGKTAEDYIEDGTTGRVLSDKQEEFMPQIQVGLQDSRRLAEIGLAARERAVKVFSHEVLAPQWRDALAPSDSQ